MAKKTVPSKQAEINYRFDWNELAFGSKKAVRQLKATFIMAPRELSIGRFTQLVIEHLPKGNIILGLAKEAYIDSFDGQPQFRTLRAEAVQAVIDKVNTSQSPSKIYTLDYFQRDVDYLLEKLDFERTVLINGSWLSAFHNRSTYYMLVNKRINFAMASPFVDDAEAKAYLSDISTEILESLKLPAVQTAVTFTEAEMFEVANRAAKLSFDYSFQTGLALGKQQENGEYSLLSYTYNKVVPYETYAMHHGAAREVNFSPPNDLNHYDTVHAEIDNLINAQKQHIDLAGTTLFINLLPCPTCARALCLSDIAEFAYREDHSDGYAIKLLELAGKTVRRVV